MIIDAVLATPEDIGILVAMYAELAEEQAALRKMWPLADGLDEPIAESFVSLFGDSDSVLYLGRIDAVPLGFIWARTEPLLSTAGGRRIGVIRLIFTDHEARGVGVGHEMVTAAMEELRGRGVSLFDAIVSPGHRNAKNFFEAHGFSARSIVMHHDDADDEEAGSAE